MPHATLPAAGFQAFILCGPGESLHPFNSNPRDFPKCLIPIANRPMIWYALDWCHRLGTTTIHLIIATESAQALDSAVSQNPYLTSLPSPKPTILAPEDLDLTTGTAELFRLPEVQKAIAGDFVILPCDLVCELAGTCLLESWTTLQGSSNDEPRSYDHRGGLGVWYETKNGSEDGVGVKKEETDFLATTKIPSVPAVGPAKSSLLPCTCNVVLCMPSDTLKDQLIENESMQVRTSLLKKHGNVKMHVSKRDAHVYFLPYWVKSYLQKNEDFDSIGEDMLGWWAKAGWQSGLAQKLGLDEALRSTKRRKSEPGRSTKQTADLDLDLDGLSSTHVTDLSTDPPKDRENGKEATFASRVQSQTDGDSTRILESQSSSVTVPPLLAYLHPSHYIPPRNDAAPNQKQKQQKQQKPADFPQINTPDPLIRRVDTVPLLLSVSLYLARLSSLLEQFPPETKVQHPYLPIHQVHPATILPPQATIDTKSCIIDANAHLSSRITIRDSVIGANCTVASGARLHGCLLMEGCVVEEKAVLNGCVLGRHVKVGKSAELKDVWAHEGYVIGEGAVVKGEILAGFEGVDDGSIDGVDDDYEEEQ